MSKRKITFFLSACCCILAMTSCGDDGRVGSSSSPSHTSSTGSLMSSHVSSDLPSAVSSEESGILSDGSDLMSTVSDLVSDMESRLESGNVGDNASR